MAYAQSVKPPSLCCWKCDHFLAINPVESVQGYCRKGAPCGLDLYGAISASLLTTKGDLLTRDLSSLVRLPVGANGTVLTANILAPDGIEWAEPAPSPIVQHEYQGMRFGTQVSGLVTFTREGFPPDLTANTVIESTAASYDAEPSDMAPFMIPADPTSQIIAVQIGFTAAAVQDPPPVGAAPFVRMLIYEWVTGAGHSLLGTIDIPLDPAKVASTFDVSVPNFFSNLYILPSPLSGFTSGIFGFMLDINGGGNEKINAVKNVTVRIYATTDFTDAGGFALAKKSIDGFDDDSDEDLDKDLEEDLRESEEELLKSKALREDTENYLARLERFSIEDPFKGNIDPNVITSAASLAKWCLIKVAPNEWCGEFKPASHTVPAIPPFVYPVPTPP